jgi:hypothetical protein
MTIATEAGYTWTNGKYARLLHRGNKLRIKSVSATAEAVSGNSALVNNDLTVDRWKPFANGLTDPSDYTGDDWTATNLTIGGDTLTLIETVTSGQHDISQPYTFTAVEHVAAVRVERQTVPEVQLRANDGTTSFTAFFDLRDGTVGTQANCTAQIFDLGNDQFELTIRFTPVAAAGVVELLMSNGSETVSYAGVVTNTIKALRMAVHASSASLRLDTFTAQAGTCMAIGAHNLGLTGARINFEHDSNNDDTWTSIGTLSPSDDSAIMFFFASVSSSRWRITVDRGVLPEIGVLHVGDPLVFERPFYAGFTPARMGRATEVIGNLSGNGELMGRSKRRTLLTEKYEWQHLTYTWVRTNIDTPSGIIQNLEANAAFIAWRPELTSDASYIMSGKTSPPSSMGISDLWSFGFEAEVYSYE